MLYHKVRNVRMQHFDNVDAEHGKKRNNRPIVCLFGNNNIYTHYMLLMALKSSHNCLYLSQFGRALNAIIMRYFYYMTEMFRAKRTHCLHAMKRHGCFAAYF